MTPSSGSTTGWWSGLRRRAIIACGILVVGFALLHALMRIGWIPQTPLHEYLAVVLAASVVLVAPARPLTMLVIVAVVALGMWVSTMRAPQLLIAANVLAAYWGGRSRHPAIALALALGTAAIPLFLTVADVMQVTVTMLAIGSTGEELSEVLFGPYGLLAMRRSWGGGLLDLLIVAITAVVTVLGISL